jgi:hypothetical protein
LHGITPCRETEHPENDLRSEIHEQISIVRYWSLKQFVLVLVDTAPTAEIPVEVSKTIATNSFRKAQEEKIR